MGGRRKERGLYELYAENPERADRLVFGRVSHPDRRGFLKGANIPFHRHLPAGLIPATMGSRR
jgi:hypothetical protein